MSAKGRCQQCPKCGALYSAQKDGRALNCTACLMEHAEIVQLVYVDHSDTLPGSKSEAGQ